MLTPARVIALEQHVPGGVSSPLDKRYAMTANPKSVETRGDVVVRGVRHAVRQDPPADQLPHGGGPVRTARP